MNGARIAEYQGKINSFSEIHNFSEFIEYILPYSIAKVYMTANRRWSFLEKKRRKLALSILINRIIRRFAFNLWDVRYSNGGFMEDFHTMPVIGVISALTTEYAIQEGYTSQGANFSLATFKLCGEGIISSAMKQKIDKLYELKIRRENNLSIISKREKGMPVLYDIAVNTLYELEECLLSAHQTKSELQEHLNAKTA